ncbi:MAG TPA: NlpC/P60 family protein [Nakamurella sp.]|nr:NlpC/P60 family protein [Nakamurella sp.]
MLCVAVMATLTASWGAMSAAAEDATVTLPTCLPGQEAATDSGSGTPAPLGNLQHLPTSVAAGGIFAGIALDAEQVKMAAIITAVGKQMGITRRGVEIALAVATEQSSLRPEAINGDWLGLFQQNPEMYTQYRRTEPGGAAWMFYDQLLKQVPGYDTDPRADFAIGDVVQKTGTGERFGQYQQMARDLAGRLIDDVSLQQDDVTCVPAAGTATQSGSGFDPGNIISDAVFYDTASMTVQQIREFIRAEGEGCTGSYCLKNLRVTTRDMPADRYCAAYRGGTNEDAAVVIEKLSVACGINPQVMLTTLQKESALLTRNGVTESTYNAAWGWHCPDTGPGGTANCDPAYAGFFNQGYGMAKQWSRYKLDPEKYNYRAGQRVNILWNVVESGCGSAPVTIKNAATASLYIYTPYQPNAAALTAYPGVGDACSAYGNRNFFYLFRKYFGSTGGGTSTAVLATGPAVKIPSNVYVSTALAGKTITAPNPAVAAGLAAGLSALGMPYVWGGGGSGAGPNSGCARGGGEFNSCGTTIGFDCSGLTAFVLGKAGYQIPGDSGSQRSAGVSVSWDQALPGDIVGFPGHVAVYLGTFGGRPYILEASWVGTPIHIVPLTRTDMDDRLHRYWTGPAAGRPGVADFSTLLQGQSTGPASSSGSAAASQPPSTDDWSWTGLPDTSATAPQPLPWKPHITPHPWPAPVVVTPAPAPAPTTAATPTPKPIPTRSTPTPTRSIPKPTTPKPPPPKPTTKPKPKPTTKPKPTPTTPKTTPTKPKPKPTPTPLNPAPNPATPSAVPETTSTTPVSSNSPPTAARPATSTTSIKSATSTTSAAATPMTTTATLTSESVAPAADNAASAERTAGTSESVPATTAVVRAEPSATTAVVRTEPSATTAVARTEPSATTAVATTEPPATTAKVTKKSRKPAAEVSRSGRPAPRIPGPRDHPVLESTPPMDTSVVTTASREVDPDPSDEDADADEDTTR